jgi:hypothetical protein
VIPVFSYNDIMWNVAGELTDNLAEGFDTTYRFLAEVICLPAFYSDNV